MDSQAKSAVSRDYLDQRVRGHDFLAYFRAHLMTICLVFWFFTISVSVAATAIYLIKKMEIESKKHVPAPTLGTTLRSGRVGHDQSTTETNYVDIDVVGFLIDTFYHGSEESSEKRAAQAANNSSTTNFTVPPDEHNNYDENN